MVIWNIPRGVDDPTVSGAMAGTDVKLESPSNEAVRTGCRAFYIVLTAFFIYNYSILQSVVDSSWLYLRSSWAFNSVYFETWWAIVCAIIILAVPFICSKLRHFDRYKIDPKLTWQDAGLLTIILEIAEYVTPLMLLDTFIVKKYQGVDPEEWTLRRESWIQTTRALPVRAPSVVEVVAQLVLSLVIYDALFYCVHALLHKNLWLYKHVHAAHHEHEIVHSRVTNQLTVAERVVLILAANQALKMVHGHPLTRMLFVPVFESWLVENHCGYDFPWSIDKVIPFGLIGGARHHVEHHMKGSRNYQPFFTYIDRIVNRNVKEQ